MSLNINYLTEPVPDYNAALTGATTLATLRDVMVTFDRVAHDAKVLVDDWTEADFKDWRKALASERRGKFMGDDAVARFALVLMPDVLFRVAIVADYAKAPWGCAFIRMVDANQIVEVDGVASVVVEGAP